MAAVVEVDSVVSTVAKQCGDDVKDELCLVNVEKNRGHSVQRTVGDQLHSHIHLYKSIEVVKRFIL